MTFTSAPRLTLGNSFAPATPSPESVRDFVRARVGDHIAFGHPDPEVNALRYRQFAALIRSKGLENGPDHEVQFLLGRFNDCLSDPFDEKNPLSSVMQPALSRAISNRNLASIRELVACRADLDEAADLKIQYGGGEDLRIIIEAGLGPDYPGLLNVIQDASKDTRFEKAAIFLGAGASPDGQEHGLPLNEAIRRRDPEMIAFLLDNGASPNGRPDDVAPLNYAILWDDRRTIALLLERGANANGNGFQGKPPIAEAMKHGLIDVAVSLFRRGAVIQGMSELQEKALRAALQPYSR
jgi:ankyrin repeat protein